MGDTLGRYCLGYFLHDAKLWLRMKALFSYAFYNGFSERRDARTSSKVMTNIFPKVIIWLQVPGIQETVRKDKLHVKRKLGITNTYIMLSIT